MSTPEQPINKEALARLMEAYLLGTLTDEQIDQFEAGLLKTPEAADRCAEAIETVAMTREVFRDYREQRAILNRDETLEDFHGLLAELGEAEERAETHLVHLVGQVKEHRPLWQQWQFVIPSGIAALLAIAVILIVTLPTGTPSGFTDNTQPKPAESAQPILRDTSVATITATHNAVWESPQAEGALAPGSHLHPNDRLTLTAGFAEITTHRGAIAILQAPATIELLNNENALRLHTGKLVGICETDASKGFLVRTPHLDITDLGTRFGIDVTQADATQVHVFQGEVNLSLPGQDTPNRERLLTAGQAVAAHAHSRLFQPVQTDPDQFVAIQQIADRGLSRATNVQGIHAISGELQTIAAEKFVGTDENQWPMQPSACVFKDYSGPLSADVSVNAASPGDISKTRSDAGATIPAGTHVQSYIILKTAAALGKETEVVGSVTFDHQVIGVITEEATANTFVQATADNATVFEHEPGGDRWIELFGSTEGFAISEDRKTITFQFKVKQGHDTIRVLVASKETDPKP